jgi:hypothetical protein
MLVKNFAVKYPAGQGRAMGCSPLLRGQRTKLSWTMNPCAKRDGSLQGAMRFPRMFQEMVMALKKLKKKRPVKHKK